MLRVNSNFSNFFSCNIGVRQGENLSPLLFSLFLNDLKDFFQNNSNVQGIILQNEQNTNELFDLLKIFILLYADDTVIMAETANDLQEALNTYEQYCDTWKLKVNTSKTKIVIFAKGRQPRYNFTFKNEALEVVNEYKYLGLYFNRSGSFLSCKKHISNQATRAMYSLIKNSNRLNLPIDLQIDLFNKTVKPILLYGAEIWGFGKLDLIERVQLKFLKYILKLKRSTPNYFVYGETGCMPLSIDIEEKIISFWSRLCVTEGGDTPNKLSSAVYKNILRSTETIPDEILQVKYPWLHNVRYILIKCGLINIWTIQNFPNTKWLKMSVKQKLQDLFLNNWYHLVENSSNSTFYRVFKKSFGIESYLSELQPSLLYDLIKFRTRNHRLPIETGNWSRIPINERNCNSCRNKIGDEFHYLFECEQFSNDRRQFIKPYFYRRSNMFKLEKLMCTGNKSEFLKLCKFIKVILRTVRM